MAKDLRYIQQKHANIMSGLHGSIVGVQYLLESKGSIKLSDKISDREDSLTVGEALENIRRGVQKASAYINEETKQ